MTTLGISALAAAEPDAVELLVELDEPPQAVRPAATAEIPAAFRKFRREIHFFMIVLLLMHLPTPFERGK